LLITSVWQDCGISALMRLGLGVVLNKAEGDDYPGSLESFLTFSLIFDRFFPPSSDFCFLSAF